jgi:uncharacterized membrane protein
MVQNFPVLFQPVIVVVTLVFIQLILGKKASFPYGVLVGMSPVNIGVIVLIADIGLMFFAQALLENSLKLKWLKKLQQKIFISEDKLERSWWLRSFQNLGRLGVVVVTSIPLSGGLWTGLLMSKVLGLGKVESYALVALGSAFGCAVFVVSFLGIIYWVS